MKRKPIPEAVKAALVAEYVPRKVGYQTLATKYGLSKGQVAYWINPEKRRAPARQARALWRQDPANRQLNIEACQQWRNEDPEATREYDRSRYAASPKKRLQVLSWQHNNPVKRRRIRQKYEARCRAAEGSGFTDEQWCVVLETCWNNSCAYCQVAFSEENPTTVDHVTPLDAGGSHHPSNLVPACFSCNSSKSSRLLASWRDGQHAWVEEFAKQIAETLCLS